LEIDDNHKNFIRVNYDRLYEYFCIFSRAKEIIPHSSEEFRDELKRHQIYSVRGLYRIKKPGNISKEQKRVEDQLNNMGIFPLWEVTTPYTKRLRYDYAFMYRGYLGEYLYFLEYDGEQHFGKNYKGMKTKEQIAREHSNDVFKAKMAKTYYYIIYIDNKNVDNVELILNKAFSTSDRITVSDPLRYQDHLQA
jgi:hypothetical protein